MEGVGGMMILPKNQLKKCGSSHINVFTTDLSGSFGVVCSFIYNRNHMQHMGGNGCRKYDIFLSNAPARVCLHVASGAKNTASVI